MALHLALLRAINVGGRNKLPMKELTTAMTAANFSDVRTYLQTGNVVFEAPAGRDIRVGDELSALIRKQFGIETPVIVRTPEQISSVARNNPFLNDEENFKKLHVLFLDRRTDDRIEQLDDHRSPGDRFVVSGTEIFLYLPNGAARTKLTINYFEKQLGVIATGRNWNTVTALEQMLIDGNSG